MYTVDRGYGIFDTGATGNAISKHQLDQLREDDPDAEPRQQVLEYVPKLLKQDL